MAIMATLVVSKSAIRNILKCDKCGDIWIARNNKIPVRCLSCGSTLWNRPRKKCKQEKLGKNAERVIEIVKANSCIYNNEIGQILGISRERVRQIRERAGLPKRPSRQKKVYCLNCGDETFNKKYCCRACEHEYTYPLVECHECGILFRRNSFYLIHKYFPYHFHNRSCRSRFLMKSRWKKSKALGIPAVDDILAKG